MNESNSLPKKRSNRLLADSLEKAKAATLHGVLRSASIDRAVRERLVKASFLTEVIRGWYLLTNPVGAGTTTLWYSNYWEFTQQYLADRFGAENFCLSAESSLSVYAAQNIISQQLIVITKKPSNQTIELPHNTSLLLYSDERNFPLSLFKKDGLNLFPLAEAVCRAAPLYFQQHTLNIEICLKLIPSASEISRVLLTMQSPTAASRIIGAYRRLGDVKKAEQISQDMAAAGIAVTPHDPFNTTELHLGAVDRLTSPYEGRIQAMWKRLRPAIIDLFPEPPSPHPSAQKTLRIIEKLYIEDAYHSLSIEGYRVTEDLIRRMKDGGWNPDSEKSDSELRNSLAAKGYLGAFRSVTESIRKALKGENPGTVFSNDLQSWYRELFTPLVQAQLTQAPDLAGYRNHQVYISHSRHVPPPKTAVPDAMNALEKLLKDEESAAVRAVLGHFIFVFIHPYMDGNGRIGRFIMNLMLVAGGYNWTVIRTSERTRYMASLEAASTEGRIEDFVNFVASEMKHWKEEVEKMDIK